LREAAQRVIDRHPRQTRISPSWVATETMVILDPERQSKQIVYFGCHLQVRQIARDILRGRFVENGDKSAQHELFPELQKMYPTARSKDNEDDPEYVALEHMTKDDIDYNVARLRAEAEAKLKHADSLEAWGRRKFPPRGRPPRKAA